jgi:hypothetical protein
MKQEHAGERVAGHDSKFLESWELIGSIRRWNRLILGPLEEANDSWFCQQKIYNKIHKIFLEAIHHHSGGTVKSLPIDGLVCNVFIKVPHIGKRQMSKYPDDRSGRQT